LINVTDILYFALGKKGKPYDAFSNTFGSFLTFAVFLVNHENCVNPNTKFVLPPQIFVALILRKSIAILISDE